jgi:hypothetical protein
MTFSNCTFSHASRASPNEITMASHHSLETQVAHISKCVFFRLLDPNDLIRVCSSVVSDLGKPRMPRSMNQKLVHTFSVTKLVFKLLDKVSES